jgi:SAM-dependent methyltransferase
MRLWINTAAVWQDWWYGIDTSVWAPNATGQTHADASPYEPLRYAAVHVILREVAFGADDVFFDVGCGKGRILCVLARQRLRKCVGIEYVPDLAAAAVANSRRARGLRTPIEIRTEDAPLADYSDATIAFFYNPFGVDRMRRCLARIRESLQTHPRRVRIVYANPLAEQAFRECAEWLAPVASFQVPYVRRWDPSTVTVWETR